MEKLLRLAWKSEADLGFCKKSGEHFWHQDLTRKQLKC